MSTDPDGTAAVVRALEPERLFAVDLEADAMHAFRARLCYLQIGNGPGHLAP
jgi:ribonuclease D